MYPPETCCTFPSLIIHSYELCMCMYVYRCLLVRPLLVDALLKSPLTTSQTHGDMRRARFDVLSECLIHLRAFLKCIISLEFPLDTSTATTTGTGLSSQHMKRLKQIVAMEEEQVDGVIQSAAVTRADKIEKYKREKQLAARVNHLFDQRRHHLDKPATEASESAMEDWERDWVMAVMVYWVSQSLEMWDSVRQERDLLSNWIKNDPSPTTSTTRPSSPLYSADQPQPHRQSVWEATGPLLSQQGRPLRPFTLTRDALAQSVFRPSHALPTLTLDEYLHREHERGNVITGGGKQGEMRQAREKQARQALLEMDGDQQAEEAVEQEVSRLRQWDAFKEDHPRGWGNQGGNRG